jgi:hypothetical protein
LLVSYFMSYVYFFGIFGRMRISIKKGYPHGLGAAL